MSPARDAKSAPAPLLRETDETRLRRYPERASYSREEIYAVLDEALVCHMGFAVDDQPYVIPTLCARVDDALYLHGSAASRALRTMKRLPRVCVTATIIDGIVLARSAFYHSINYRSVVILGDAASISDPGEKLQALERFMYAIVDGRWGDVRPPSQQELKATEILRMPIEQASLKSRNGPPSDLPEDHRLPVWSGVIPLELRPLPAVPDPTLRPGIATPDYVENYALRTGDHPLLEELD
jgi:nitroimidazol reductase NimA-like FMN-containing flavoprotein (pyridoxamine 5'-phosphate oxidase superfamily)